MGSCLVLAVVLAAVLFPVRESLLALLERTRGIGFWGYPVLAGVYIIATVLVIPCSILTLAAGFLFGVIGGAAVVSVGSTLGAGAAFLVGRYVVRGALAQRLVGRPRFQAIDDAVARQGLKIVLLTRLTPVFPYNLLNYAYGLTRVRFRTYLLGSWIGMFPGIVLFVYLGSTAQDLAEIAAGDVRGGGVHTLIKCAGLLVAIVATVIVTRIARRELRQTAPRTQPESTTG